MISSIEYLFLIKSGIGNVTIDRFKLSQNIRFMY